MNRNKGDGTKYFERALEMEKELTPEEKDKQEKWWEETKKKFKVIGEDKNV